ncbi:MAG: hypothetical protein HZA89_14745 [Verrucomicrobia bacterium]|nr:hypothetical protein [Verrucomicrobiota bacterium]
MKTVYLETSIFSFYYDARQQSDIIARRDWTREFWETCRSQFNFVTSTAGLAELRRGSKPHKEDALKLALTLPAVAPENAVAAIVRVYLEHKLMPADPAGDVLHLALASFNRHDFLATWNCQHLANAGKADHIQHVNDLLGLPTPRLITPMELLGVDGPD